MIPRYQSILFLVLLLASVTMGVFVWQMRDRAHKRMLQGDDGAPTAEPTVQPSLPATVYVASDADNSLVAQQLLLPLPAGSAARIRAVLGKLLDLYAQPGAPHPVPGGGTGVAQVFLLPLPADGSAQNAQLATATQPQAPQLAVVNLTGTFAHGHPSGIATEELTVLSLCATIHANLPTVREVRFLVDGAPQATLAGHADLLRTYLADEAEPAGGQRAAGDNPMENNLQGTNR